MGGDVADGRAAGHGGLHGEEREVPAPGQWPHGGEGAPREGLAEGTLEMTVRHLGQHARRGTARGRQNGAPHPGGPGQHSLGEYRVRHLVADGEQRQTIPTARLGERAGQLAHGHRAGDQRGDEHVGVPRLPVPGGGGQDELTAVDEPAGVRQIGGVHAAHPALARAAGHDRLQAETGNAEQFGQQHGVSPLHACYGRTHR